MIVASLALPLLAAPPTTCGLRGDFAKALCAYQRRDFAAAEAGFRAIVDRDRKEPQTLHAVYFLARTEMKEGRFDQASKMLVRIYGMDPAFYDTWSCDFLLGQCRRALGKE